MLFITMRVAARLILCLLLSAGSVLAWMRLMITDQQAVENAEFVVVANIIPGSIKRIDHSTKHSWEHRCTLEVVEFLKGHSEKKQLEITIHYGLDPVVGKCLSTKWEWDKNHGPVALGDPTVIGIWDTGGMDVPITEDVREPHIWLLTRKNPGYTTPESEDRPGIWEPSHIQAITQKEKLQKIISQK